MILPLVPLALFVCSAIYAAIFVAGLVSGKASTRYHRRVDRISDPLGFWAAQTFNAVFATASACGGIIAYWVE